MGGHSSCGALFVLHVLSKGIWRLGGFKGCYGRHLGVDGNDLGSLGLYLGPPGIHLELFGVNLWLPGCHLEVTWGPAEVI